MPPPPSIQPRHDASTALRPSRPSLRLSFGPGASLSLSFSPGASLSRSLGIEVSRRACR